MINSAAGTCELAVQVRVTSCDADMKRLIVPGVPRARGGGIVLPGDARRGMATLHVPAGYESDPENAPVLVGVCTVPGCEREGHPFYRGAGGRVAEARRLVRPAPP